MNDQVVGPPGDTVFDLLVVGAGPTGLACAIEAQEAGFRVALVDKGCICNSIFHYPAHMTFFTTSGAPGDWRNPLPQPERQADPQRSARILPAGHGILPARRAPISPVESITGADGDFIVHTTDRFGRHSDLKARKLALAIGYYDLPNWMGIPGETLSKVHHYYHDPHPYYGMDVAVIGGKNSAAIAALELWRHGAHVTLIHRGAGMHPHVKYWIKPDIENRIKNGEVKAYFSSKVAEIMPDTVVVDTPAGREVLHNDFVFAMTGYHPDFTFLERLGVRFEGKDRCPACNSQTLESNIPGIYLAGVIVAGSRTNEIFIENGRFHGRQIAASLVSKIKPREEKRDAVAAGDPTD